MGACSSSATEPHEAGQVGNGDKGHKPSQRSISSSRNTDPTAAKVAIISPRQSIDAFQQQPACRSSAHQQLACDGECQCAYEPEYKEAACDEAAVLSAIIVIDSPPPNNRQLLLTNHPQHDGRPASSSHSTDVPSTTADFTAAHPANHTDINSSLSPDSFHTTTLPHSISSVPASPLATPTLPHHEASTDGQLQYSIPATLSASSSPKMSFSSPSHSSHVAAVRSCPVHARSPSLSILQLLQQTNHSRSPSLLFHNDPIGEEQLAKLGAKEEEKEQTESGDDEADDTQKAPFGKVMEEAKEMTVDTTLTPPPIYRTVQ